MKKFRNQAGILRQNQTKRALSVIITAMTGFLLLIGCLGTLSAQPSSTQSTLSGTFHLYYVSEYGDKMVAAGWHYITPVALEFSRVEVLE